MKYKVINICRPSIIFGYPGIGKSTLAKEDNRFIDLESSVFKYPNGERDTNWYIVYSEMAAHIARQNRVVLMSTHPWTRDYFDQELRKGNFNDIQFAICYPDIHRKEEWIDRIENRYKEDPSDKNFTALKKVREDFEEDISILMNDTRFHKIELKNLVDRNNKLHPFDLKESLETVLNLYKLEEYDT